MTKPTITDDSGSTWKEALMVTSANEPSRIRTAPPVIHSKTVTT